MIIIFISIFAFSFQIADKNEKNIDTLQATSTPVSGKVIVLDAGHGVPDEGAQSSSRDNRGRN